MTTEHNRELDGADINEHMDLAQSDPFASIVIGEALHELTAGLGGPPAKYDKLLAGWSFTISKIVGVADHQHLVCEWLADVAGDLAGADAP